jgi:hypothetical protein
MMKLPFQGQHSLKPTAVAFSVVLYGWLLLGSPSVAPAAEADLKVGETIGPQNWQKIQGMVGENLLSRIKAGYTFQIKEPKTYRPLKEYVEATEKYSGKVSLGANGELLNYVAGQPFPKFDPNDPQIGQKLAWNFFYRWLATTTKPAEQSRQENHPRRDRKGRLGTPCGLGFLFSFSEHALLVESQTRDPRL